MEPLSAASSVFAVVSVAIELAKGIHKLVVFCKAVQDAPSGLKGLVEDLEGLGELLEQVHAVDDIGGDRIIEKAVDKCRVTVRKLEEKIRRPCADLTSESRGRRYRGRVKVVLQQSEISSLREDIERAKSQLQIAQVNSLIQISRFYYLSQKQYLLDFREDINRSTQEGFSSVLLEHARLTDTMQLLAQGESDVKNVLSLQINMETRSCPGSNTSFPARFAVKHETTAIRNRDMLNSFLAIQKRTRSRRTTKIFPSGSKSTEEEHFDYILYPANFLRRFGLAYGLFLQTRSTSWQFTLQPFNVVKETSPIFEFCRNGNLEAVQTLIGLGEASVRDRDPFGRTPLWIAAHALQPDIAELLLQEGADPHVYDWDRKCPPIAAIQESVSSDVTKKLSTISVFKTYSPDGHDSLEVWASVGKLLLTYRPQRIMSMDLGERKHAANILLQQLFHLLPQDDENWIKILFGMMRLFYDADVLRWTLGRIQGAIPQTEENDAVHRALGMKLFVTDPVSAQMIVGKTGDLHRFWRRAYSGIPPGTPTSLALYQPALFFGWVGVLREVGVDVGEFVREELEAGGGVVKGEGWEADSLMDVFELVPVEATGESESAFLRCERCGRAEGSSWLKVDLAWRRRLRDIRRKGSDASIARDMKIKVSIDGNGTESVLEKKVVAKTRSLTEAFGHGVSGIEKLPYTVVCSDECEDGVCVAWVFEEGSVAESLPPFVQCPDRDWKEAEAIDTSADECPTTRMPGAFGA